MSIVKVNLTDIKQQMNATFDLFICSSSFEGRCLSIANNINVDKIKRALILSNIEPLDYVKDNQAKLVSLFGEKGQIIKTSILNPLLTADNFQKSITTAINNGLSRSIFLDITTFTHESLLIILRLLRIHCEKIKITGGYANASEYSSGDDVKHKWLSRGIGDVRSILGYPGKIIPSRKTHLVIIVGYEHERAAGIIETIDPNSIALGFGQSSSATTEKDKDANEHFMMLVEQMATSFSNVNRFVIPCDNPRGTHDELVAQVRKVEDKNVIIAPMNNKLSTIGAAWTAFENDNIQLCYAQALSYNYKSYSSPGTQCYLFDL